MIEPHTFSSDYYRPSSCLMCVHPRNHPIHSKPAVENHREPGEFGEGATVRRAEPATDRQIELMKDFWSYYGAPPHKRELDTRLLKADFSSLIARLEIAEAALRKIAAYDDAAANAYLRATGSYGAFDEPGAVELARGISEGNK